jgi:hypothetical protein
MSKKGKKSTSTKKDNQAEKAKIKRLTKKVYNIIKDILAVLGLIFTLWWAFAPQISVDSISLLNEYNPAYIPFIIKNNNQFFSIYDIKFICKIKELKTITGSITMDSEDYNIILRELNKIDTIGPHEQSTETLPLTRIKISDRINSGDIAILISFRQSIIPWPIEKKFRFVVFTDQQGNKYWAPQPMKK